MPVIFSVARKAASIGPSPSVDFLGDFLVAAAERQLGVGFLPLPLATSPARRASIRLRPARRGFAAR